MDSADRAWKSGGVDPYADAAQAFETVTSRLADATLETYGDYADSAGSFATNAAFVPDHFARRSDLAFACGAASGKNGLLAPSGRTTVGSAIFFAAAEGETQQYAGHGLGSLLNDLGYFVDFGDDDSKPVFMLSFSHRYRWRLRQVEQPSESLQVYSAATSSAWIQQLVPPGAVVPTLAENVIALVILPDRNASDNGGPRSHPSTAMIRATPRIPSRSTNSRPGSSWRSPPSTPPPRNGSPRGMVRVRRNSYRRISSSKARRANSRRTWRNSTPRSRRRKSATAFSSARFSSRLPRGRTPSRPEPRRA